MGDFNWIAKKENKCTLKKLDPQIPIIRVDVIKMVVSGINFEYELTLKKTGRIIKMIFYSPRISLT